MCTITDIDGSFSRRLGAQLCVRGDGTVVGSMADGCLEAALVDAATGSEARIMQFGGAGDAMDLRLPCGSRLAICVDPAPDRAALRDAVARLDRRQPARIALPCGGGVRGYVPELRIVAIGTGPELSAFERQAAAFGAEVVALRPHGEMGADGLSLGQPPQVPLDPWTAAVVLFHDHEWERAILPWALRGDAFYVGAQGGKAAREQRAQYLATCALPDNAMRRMHGPVGLIAQARDPAVLALSVLSEIVADYEAIEKDAVPA